MLLVILRVYTFRVDTEIYSLCRSVTVGHVGTEVQNPIFLSCQRFSLLVVHLVSVLLIVAHRLPEEKLKFHILRKIMIRSFNCCFTVHFDKYKPFLPTNVLFIKNIKCYSLYLKYLFIWFLHVSVPLDHHQGACSGTLLKLQLL